MRLLLVEDEHRLADRLARGLREEGFAVDSASTTALARERIVETDYDLVLLDLKLPDGSGFDLLAEWRDEGFARPILILTAKDLLADKVKGLDAGADDYLSKPFSFEELLGSVELMQRFTADASHEIRNPLTVIRTGLEATVRRPPTRLRLFRYQMIGSGFDLPTASRFPPQEDWLDG